MHIEMIEKIMQTLALMFSWLFYQSAVGTEFLLDEGTKYGFSVLFLLVALIYLWKDYKRQKEDLKEMNSEFRQVFKLYNEAVKSKDEGIRSLIQSIDEQNKNISRLAESIEDHNTRARNRTKVIESLREKIDNLSEDE